MAKSLARMGKGRKGKGTTKGQPQAASAGRKGKGTTKGQPQAASAGKGATKGQPQASSAEGGGDGRGGKWRMPGTRGFLKNHRKLLTHIAKQAKIEFDQAASAREEAQRVFREAILLVSYETSGRSSTALSLLPLVAAEIVRRTYRSLQC